MATDTPTKLNTITWTEIPCTNIPRATTFYTTVFGWKTSPFQPGPTSTSTSPSCNSDPSIAMFSHHDCHGCFVKVDEENLLSAAKHPDNPAKGRMALRVTITVESVDEMAKKVVEAGGKVYQEKVEIPGGMGFLVYFTDTEMNVMGLWSDK